MGAEMKNRYIERANNDKNCHLQCSAGTQFCAGIFISVVHQPLNCKS